MSTGDLRDLTFHDHAFVIGLKADEVDLYRELRRGISYRIHSATHHGRFVAVKAFEGPRAKPVSTFLCLLLI